MKLPTVARLSLKGPVASERALAHMNFWQPLTGVTLRKLRITGNGPLLSLQDQSDVLTASRVISQGLCGL